MPLKINIVDPANDLIAIEKKLLGKYSNAAVNAQTYKPGTLINVAIQAATSSWENRLTSINNVTVNIQLKSSAVPGALMNSDPTPYQYTYAQLAKALNSSSGSPNDAVAIRSIPNGNGNIIVNSATAKALNLVAPSSNIIDGTINIGNQPWYLNTENANGNRTQSTKDFTVMALK
jgi:hypothetical protein